MAQPSLPVRTNDVSHTSPAPSNTSGIVGLKRKRTPEQKFYAVKEGKAPGIYATWPECLSQVKGHKGAQYKAFQSLQDAQAFVEGRLPMNTTSKLQRYYAVQNGRVPGVYTDWPQAQAQIRGVSKPKYKKFDTRAEAEAFVAAGKKANSVESPQNLSPEEEIRQLIVRNSAPGLQLRGTYAPTDKDGNPYDIARRPLPPGAEDGYDPNVKLAPDGTIVDRTDEERNRTKKVAREKDPPGMLRIYTDGSSLRNGQAGARAGVGVYFGPQDPKNVSEALKGSKQTNQRAELTAILRALDIAPRHRDVTIYTDSKYSIECVTNWYRNWQKNDWMNAKGKAVENKDLVVDIRDRIEERDQLSRRTLFVWVKGHQDNAGNIAADKLAVAGAVMGRGFSEEGEKDGQPTVRKSGGADRAGRRTGGDDDEDDEAKAAFDAMDRALEDGDDYDGFK
ncbi:ribonuclease HI [Capronia epimyces CBS 606.96]|uniref:Ribonuclease H n=1 Tax=Capronia epimyces CBS 606.96 TaxID=1182542 RepID=W9XHR7_9EURO|nr:ribonuclease HI [Capronia epimyces CBS 606.96]EXJ80067.1 ribonuclease HI [Capronia epimyces CBS 606.96]